MTTMKNLDPQYDALENKSFYSPSNYSGLLGMCWFEKGQEKAKEKYIEEIKSKKISIIKLNNLVLESIEDRLIKFSKKDGDTYSYYAFTFESEYELQEILERTNSVLDPIN